MTNKVHTHKAQNIITNLLGKLAAARKRRIAAQVLELDIETKFALLTDDGLIDRIQHSFKRHARPRTEFTAEQVWQSWLVS